MKKRSKKPLPVSSKKKTEKASDRDSKTTITIEKSKIQKKAVEKKKPAKDDSDE